MKLRRPEITWEANKVVVCYERNQSVCFDYLSLPLEDLVIPGFDCSEFNQMVNGVRYVPKQFVKNFKCRNDDPPGYQRCRAINLLKVYPNSFNIVCNSFCIIAYRYIHDGMGSIKEIEDLYQRVTNLELSGDFYYRWITSVWTALAHSYVKAGNNEMALDTFNKVHTYDSIKSWPSALVNILGACFVTNQSRDYSVETYTTAIENFKVKSTYSLSEIIVGSRILKVIMGDNSVQVPPLYKEAYSFLKIR